MRREGERLIFSGEFDHRIDSQGRIAIPARFRAAFASGIVLTRGYDQCIVAHTPDQWQRVAEEMALRPTTQANARRLARLTFSGAYPAELDRQGRVLIPGSLRQYAGIGEEAVIVGAGTFLEIWSGERWAVERRALDEEAGQIAERAADTPFQAPGSA